MQRSCCLDITDMRKAVDGIKMLARLPEAQRGRIANLFSRQRFEAGEFIVKQRENGSALYIIESGTAAVQIAGVSTEDLPAGSYFGDVSLLMDTPIHRTIVAVDPVSCMKLKAVDMREMLEKLWGGRREVLKRKAIVSKVAIFGMLEPAELLNIAVGLERVQFEPGTEVVKEGEPGDSMYIVESGSLSASVVGVGVVKEYCIGDFFGEIAVLTDGRNERKATVTSSKTDAEIVVCLKLSRSEFARHISREHASDILDGSRREYAGASNLRASEAVRVEMNHFYEMMVSESSRLSAVDSQEVSREGYCAMHLRISKALSAEEDFNVQEGSNIANGDWAHDIADFSGDSHVKIWLEEIKKKFNDSFTGDLHVLFKKYDSDLSGEIDMKEFSAAVRSDGGLSDAVVSDEDLQSLFKEVDADGSGEINADEFNAFLTSDPLACAMSLSVFSESMWQLLMLWVREGSSPEHYAAFLGSLFDRITTRVVLEDGTVGRDLRQMIVSGSNYSLSQVAEVKTFVDKTGKVNIPGVPVNQHFLPSDAEETDEGSVHDGDDHVDAPAAAAAVPSLANADAEAAELRQLEIAREIAAKNEQARLRQRKSEGRWGKSGGQGPQAVEDPDLGSANGCPAADDCAVNESSVASESAAHASAAGAPEQRSPALPAVGASSVVTSRLDFRPELSGGSDEADKAVSRGSDGSPSPRPALLGAAGGDDTGADSTAMEAPAKVTPKPPSGPAALSGLQPRASRGLKGRGSNMPDSVQAMGDRDDVDGHIATPLAHWNSSCWHRHPNFGKNGPLLQQCEDSSAVVQSAARRRAARPKIALPMSRVVSWVHTDSPHSPTVGVQGDRGAGGSDLSYFHTVLSPRVPMTAPKVPTKAGGGRPHPLVAHPTVAALPSACVSNDRGGAQNSQSPRPLVLSSSPRHSASSNPSASTAMSTDINSTASGQLAGTAEISALGSSRGQRGSVAGPSAGRRLAGQSHQVPAPSAGQHATEYAKAAAATTQLPLQHHQQSPPPPPPVRPLDGKEAETEHQEPEQQELVWPGAVSGMSSQSWPSTQPRGRPLVPQPASMARSGDNLAAGGGQHGTQIGVHKQPTRQPTWQPTWRGAKEDWLRGAVPVGGASLTVLPTDSMVASRLPDKGHRARPKHGGGGFVPSPHRQWLLARRGIRQAAPLAHRLVQQAEHVESTPRRHTQGPAVGRAPLRVAPLRVAASPQRASRSSQEPLGAVEGHPAEGHPAEVHPPSISATGHGQSRPSRHASRYVNRIGGNLMPGALSPWHVSESHVQSHKAPSHSALAAIAPGKLPASVQAADARSDRFSASRVLARHRANLHSSVK